MIDAELFVEMAVTAFDVVFWFMICVLWFGVLCGYIIILLERRREE